MAKNKKKKGKHTPRVTPGKKRNTSLFGNLVLSISLVIIFIFMYQAVPSYKWIVDSLVISNLKIIQHNPDLTLEQKYAAKLGFDARYIDYVKKSTPENAVILMPPYKEFAKGEFNRNGSWGVKSKTWCTYFLYPRIVIRESDCAELPDLCQKISHVMIINNWGYDKLEYNVGQKNKYGVLPVRMNGETK